MSAHDLDNRQQFIAHFGWLPGYWKESPATACLHNTTQNCCSLSFIKVWLWENKRVAPKCEIMKFISQIAKLCMVHLHGSIWLQHWKLILIPLFFPHLFLINSVKKLSKPTGCSLQVTDRFFTSSVKYTKETRFQRGAANYIWIDHSLVYLAWWMLNYNILAAVRMGSFFCFRMVWSISRSLRFSSSLVKLFFSAYSLASTHIHTEQKIEQLSVPICSKRLVVSNN